MFAIYKKELKSFFDNATGYVVIAIFLLLTGLFLWLIPGSFNILDSGYANVEGLFYLAPWLFLFLIPAVTMRSFAEEKQSGTWEIIRTKPIRESSIVGGKYLAALTVIILALLPTVIYYFSVSSIAQPAGNVDAGQFRGSFIGLFFLAAVYTAIGIFTSGVAKNQLVAFIAAALLSFTLYYGPELIALFFKSGSGVLFLENLGIHAHYKSMSRGVIDSRDILYTLVVAALFIWLTARSIRRG